MTSTGPAPTPMLRQYRRIKEQHPGAILFFRLGDFYEMFFDDAEVASAILDITLTARHRGTPSEVPMCGVPHHSASGYIVRLLRAGHKVAVAEQVEEAKPGRGMVRREVVRVLTPGTLTEDDLLDSRDNNYLVAVSRGPDAVGLAALDVSTGEFVAAQLDGPDALLRAAEEISRWGPLEVCYPDTVDPRDWLPDADSSGRLVDSIRTWSPLPAYHFDPDRGDSRLTEHFGVVSLDGFDLAGQGQAIGAAGALLGYVGETHRAPLRHIRSIRRYRNRDTLQLDAITRRALELVESWQEGDRAVSLLGVIDSTVTAMGARRLRQWVLRPLRSPEAIDARLDVVEVLVADVRARDGMRDRFRGVRDLERLATRVTVGTASPRDLEALRVSLETIPDLREHLENVGGGELGRRLLVDMDPCADVAEEIGAWVADNPPAKVAIGSVIREGCDDELDRLRRARSDGRGFIAELEGSLRESTGIGSLKVGFNKVFGYYIEVSKANLDRVPEEFTRKQTLVNAERFVTPELKEFEETVLGAEERIGALEEELFTALRERVAERAGRLRGTADALGSLDALLGFAETAARHGFARPVVDDGPVLEIRGGRHPVVESLQTDGRFVPNDTYLDAAGHRIALVTGPNMGGKSTYLRQIALIVVLAQAGSFVPADGACIGVVDRVFTRVGASDNLARGASTFLVEMQETANILHNASPRSLILLDEVGRGTSTYDGLAIAWAVLEHLHDEPRVAARTLFATHYHELTVLADRLEGVTNLSVDVEDTESGVVFVHRVVPGPADRSYGIHVGRLAGLPASLVDRAESILETLEDRGSRSPVPTKRPLEPDAQMALFEAPESPVLRELREIDVDRLTPLEALVLLQRLRDSARG